MNHAARTVDWYDLPVLYDILHAPGTAQEVTGLQRIAARFLPPARRARPLLWLEPACGTARHLRVAAGRGERVMGFDRSRAMIDYARSSFRRRGLRGRLFVGDMTDYRPPVKADFAFCTINTIRHLTSDAAALAHLECTRRALRPGGVYAVGIELCRYGFEFPSEDIWEGAQGRCRVKQMVEYLPAAPRGPRARLERVLSHLLVSTPSGRRHLDTVYDLRSYSQGEWESLVERSGFEVAGVCDPMGDEPVRGPRGRIVGGYALWVLRGRR